MTREEFRDKKSKDYRKHREAYGIKDPVYLDEIEEAYYQGMIDADKYPHWISVEEELPKLNSGMVIVATYKGDIDFMIFSNSGWHNSRRWCCVKGVITHWMPLPSIEHLKNK